MIRNRIDRIAVLLTAVLACAAAASAGAEGQAVKADDFPQVTIANGMATLTLYLPAGEKGYYVGSRFEPSGVVARAEAKGHTFFGPWQKRDPRSHDHIMGTAEEFSMYDPPGFREVEAGGVFYKIGVGELVKSEKPTRDKETGEVKPAEFGFWRNHEIARRGPWKVTHGKDWAQFVQEFTGQRGWGWRYTKRLSLTKGAASFEISRRLENTGTKAIDTTHYCHHFTIIDDTPVGPDYVIGLPFEAQAKEIKGDAATVAGRQILFQKPLTAGRTVWMELAGLTGTPRDNAVVIENRKTGASLRITGDRPLVMFRFWAAPKAACPEPFVAVTVAPGAAMTWSNTYTFEVGAAPKTK